MTSPKNGKRELGSVEIYFAKKLANNDKKIRDRAVKRMKLWLSSRTGGSFSTLDMLKLWKGLFYCMWFSDKPLVQEDLANSLAMLIHALKDTTAVCKFSEGFFMTIGREWHGIDRLRLDKFYMLIRKVTNEICVYLKNKCWSHSELERVMSVLTSGPCCTQSETYPDGVRMFLAEVYLDEIVKVLEGNALDPNIVLKLIDPFLPLLAQTQNILVFRSIESQIIKRFLPTNEDKIPNLDVNLLEIGVKLFKVASEAGVSTKTRKSMFKYSHLFKEADSLVKEQALQHENEKKKKPKKRKHGKDEKSAKKGKRQKKTESKHVDEEVEIVKHVDEEVEIKKTIGKNIATIDGNYFIDQKVEDFSDEVTSRLENQSSTSEAEPVVFESDDPVVKKLDFKCAISKDVDKMKKPKKGKAKRVERKKMDKVEQVETEDHAMLETSVDDRKQDNLTSERETKEVENDVKVKKGKPVRKSLSKPKKGSKTEMVTRSKTRISKTKNSDSINNDTPQSQKKNVVFELSKNVVTSISNLKVNPLAVFTPDQKPTKGVLKPSKSTPRMRASEFF